MLAVWICDCWLHALKMSGLWCQQYACLQVYLQLQEPQLGQMKGLRSALENARELKQKEADGARGLGGDKSGQQMIMELYQKCAALKVGTHDCNESGVISW